MEEVYYHIAICLEGFFYVLYCGIFALYIRLVCAFNSGRRASIVFCALCLLFVLSTVTFVADLVKFLLEVLLFHFSTSANSRLTIFRLTIIQATASGCCDFLAQCILIYRCWIVWGKNIPVVILPSLLAITYLVTWIGTGASASVLQVARPYYGIWSSSVLLTSFAASMAVNTLVTGLIVFKILKVFLEVRVTTTTTSTTSSISSLAERTLDSAAGFRLRRIIFIIIESGMVLFAIQLVRVVLYSLPGESPAINGVNIVIGINQMFNGIAPTIILVRVSMNLSFNDEESFREAASARSLPFNNPPSDPSPNTLQLQQMGSSINTPAEDSERNTSASEKW